MWIVYLIDVSGFDWGHKYFNHEENAQKHFEMLEKVKMYSLPCMNRIFTEDQMSRKRYHILAKCYDKRKRVISVGENSYTKTSTIMSHFAEKAGLPDKLYWHAEGLALVRCKDKVPYRLTVERYDNQGEQALAAPCPVCKEMIKTWGVKILEYTSPKGWVREVL